jgi:maltose alpha-D-glucosyltransferase/alpha-amylase
MDAGDPLWFKKALIYDCENLPETHAFLKRLRARIDSEYRGRILLAEANQWPADVRFYFGEGDEFHTGFIPR